MARPNRAEKSCGKQSKSKHPPILVLHLGVKEMVSFLDDQNIMVQRGKATSETCDELLKKPHFAHLFP